MSYVGNVPTTAAFPFDQFSGNGSTTAFTLSYAPAGSTSIIVSISGVVQNPNTYSVSGTTLTFTPAPPSGTNNIAVLYLGLPVVATLTPGNTAYFSQSVFTATAGQTVFAPSGTYQVGFLNVIRNGSQLAPADYTATNGTTVTLANACTAGDTVVIEVFNLVSLANAIPATGGAFTGAISAPTVSVPTGTLYPLVSGTAVSASGTSVDFTGIPSTAKRITVMFSGISLSGTALFLIQAGTSSGFVTTGYLGAMALPGNAVATQAVVLSNGVQVYGLVAAQATSGTVQFTLISGNTWVFSGAFGIHGIPYAGTLGGTISLSGVLDRIRITTTNGTDTFDAGTINIMWE